MRERPWNERYTPWGVAGVVAYVAATIAVIAWGLQLEEPYPCSGRHNCGAEKMR